MNDTVTKPKTRTKIKVERPKLDKVILINDDYTPREFVTMILKAEFRMTQDQAYKVMITAHKLGRLRRRRVHQGCRRDQVTRATDAADEGRPTRCCS